MIIKKLTVITLVVALSAFVFLGCEPEGMAPPDDPMEEPAPPDDPAAPPEDPAMPDDPGDAPEGAPDDLFGPPE